MLALVSRKLLSTLLVVLGATFCTSSLMRFAPGDPALEIAVSRYGSQYEVDQATVERIRESEGLDKPVHLQYLHWLRHLLRLDLDRSLVEEAPIAQLISQRFPKTLFLTAAACLVALSIFLPLGAALTAYTTRMLRSAVIKTLHTTNRLEGSHQQSNGQSGTDHHPVRSSLGSMIPCTLI